MTHLQPQKGHDLNSFLDTKDARNFNTNWFFADLTALSATTTRWLGNVLGPPAWDSPHIPDMASIVWHKTSRKLSEPAGTCGAAMYKNVPHPCASAPVKVTVGLIKMRLLAETSWPCKFAMVHIVNDDGKDRGGLWTARL